MLIECRVPRLWGHYNRDLEHYRPKEDREKAEAQDPLVVFGRRLIASGFLSDEEVTLEIQRQRGLVEAMTEMVLAAPLPEPADAASHVTVSNASEPCSRRPASTETMTYIAAVNAALREALEDDPATVVYGEDVGKAGGIFGASRNLQRDFGAARVFDTPIAENAILGSAIGAALGGLRPIVEIMWADFVFVAIDQLINQAANVRYVTQGRSSAPIVVRMQQGATPGSCPQHSQSIEAMLAHIPGLKFGARRDPTGCLFASPLGGGRPGPLRHHRGALALPDARRGRFGGTPEPVGRPRLCREGSDALIITWGAMVNKAMEAAERLDPGISVAVLDLRWLSPLDEAAIGRAVANSGGRVLVVHEAVRTGGFGAEIAARIDESCGDHCARRFDGLRRRTSVSRPPLSCRRRSFPTLRLSRGCPLDAGVIAGAQLRDDRPCGKSAAFDRRRGGIGSAIATTFHRLGARMLLADFDEAGVAALALSLNPSGSKVVPLGYDASSPADADAAVAACVAHFGRVDYVVPAAAIYEDQCFSAMTDEQWRRTMAINLDGVLNVSRRSLPYMQKGSAIVTIASDATHEGSSVGHVH